MHGDRRHFLRAAEAEDSASGAGERALVALSAVCSGGTFEGLPLPSLYATALPPLAGACRLLSSPGDISSPRRRRCHRRLIPAATPRRCAVSTSTPSCEPPAPVPSEHQAPTCRDVFASILSKRRPAGSLGLPPVASSRPVAEVVRLGESAQPEAHDFAEGLSTRTPLLALAGFFWSLHPTTR